jgi:hypothetical protein
MTDPPPTLAEQIDAVEWAWRQAMDLAHGKRWTKLKPHQIHDLVRRLEAAAFPYFGGKRTIASRAIRPLVGWKKVP